MESFLVRYLSTSKINHDWDFYFMIFAYFTKNRFSIVQRDVIFYKMYLITNYIIKLIEAGKTILYNYYEIFLVEQILFKD